MATSEGIPSSIDIEFLELNDNPYYILLDEVQLVARFEEVLNSLLRMDNADVYVTGSN